MITHSRRIARFFITAALVGSSVWLGACAPKTPHSARPAAEVYPFQPEAKETYYYMLLLEAAKTNDLALGGKAVNELLALTPPIEVFVDASIMYRRAEQPEMARLVLREGLKRFPQRLELILPLADTYIKQKRLDDGINIMREYVRNNPDHLEARQELGLLLYRNEQFPEAVDVLRTQPEQDRSSVTRYHLARALTRLGKNKEAISELKKAVKQAPDFVEGWAELAYVYEIEKEYVEAEKIYEHLIGMGQSGQEVWLRLIALNIALNQPDKAMELVRLGPDSDSFRYQTATEFLNEGFHEQARELLEPMLEAENPPDEVFFHLAVIAFEHEKDIHKAITYLSQIPDHSRLWPQSLHFRSRLLFSIEQHEEALRLLHKAIAFDPGAREFRDVLADMLVQLGRHDEALEAIDEALARWPDDNELLYSKALIYDSMDKRSLAIEFMEKVILADPENANALNYVGYTLADEGKNLDRALVLIEAALKIEPDKGHIIDSLAWVHFKMGNLDKAWKAIRQAVANEQRQPEIWVHYGDIAAALGKTEEARNGYQKALALDPDDNATRQKLKELQ